MQLYFGNVAIYGGGGFYLDLSRDRQQADMQLDALFDGLWLDRGTRVIFLEFTTYNPNMNLFCVVR